MPTGTPGIAYRLDAPLDLDAAIDLYRASTLGERRPVDDRSRMALMLKEANLVITAWDGDLLVGISRAFTDHAFVTYLSDLAVRASHQRLGIGRELVRRTREAAGRQATLVLLAAPAAEAYYPRVGFKHHPQAWVLREEDELA
ncbi:MAG TPA: GNAT family N-acetyltransferase [Armatimonadota bacterium]